MIAAEFMGIFCPVVAAIESKNVPKNKEPMMMVAPKIKLAIDKNLPHFDIEIKWFLATLVSCNNCNWSSMILIDLIDYELFKIKKAPLQSY